ncbi:MAG: FAD/NAD(P)-binding domain-containing protein [Monoraphidium minutum]|nr:MAG: FAD/NAD(P)-binding domain-containing protein [Monoraphidium minutum]
MTSSAGAGAAAPAARRSASVAVIGAGAAGLAAARELLREGHAPVVFEQAAEPGGVWVYTDATDADALGRGAAAGRVHSSMYVGLRTNLPREVMGFTDLPFTPAGIAAAGGASADGRRFPGHGEVLAYLRAYAARHGLAGAVRFGARVTRAAPLWPVGGGGGAGGAGAPVTAGCGPRWAVTVEEQRGSGGVETREQFDALVVCNGHYSATNLPDVEGAAAFPGLQMHSHNYRRGWAGGRDRWRPDQFAGQVVAVVGASNSGEDLCREIAGAAARVVICARSWKNAAWGADGSPFGPRANIERRGMISRLRPDGGAEFESGAPVAAVDAVVYATGYRYEFPFLEGAAAADADADAGAAGGRLLSTAGQRVCPLYRHMFAPHLAPTLAFIGLPWKVVPFPMFELQSRLVARLMSGAAALPSAQEMAADAEAFYARLAAEGVPQRWTHMMGDQQWAYNEWLADVAGPGAPRLPPWRAAMYAATGASKRSHPEDYRWGPRGGLGESDRRLLPRICLKQEAAAEPGGVHQWQQPSPRGG